MVPIFVSSSSSSSRNKKKLKPFLCLFIIIRNQNVESLFYLCLLYTVIFLKIFFSHNFCLVCLCVCVFVLCVALLFFFYWFNLSIHQSIDIFCYDWLIHRTFVHSLCIDWKQWFNSCIKIFLFSNNLLSFQRFSH
mgnify:CR=1 FL=1